MHSNKLAYFIGGLSIFTFVFLLILSSFFATIPVGSPATGKVTYEGQKIEIRSPIDGFVLASNMVDNTTVTAHSKLLEIEHDDLKNRIKTITDTISSLDGKLSRLHALSSEKQQPDFPTHVSDIDQQIELKVFNTTIDEYKKTVDIYIEKTKSYKLQTEETKFQLNNALKEYDIMSENLEIKTNLATKGMLAKTNLMEYQLQLASIEGKISSIRNSISRLDSLQNETSKQLSAFKAQYSSKIEQEISDVSSRVQLEKNKLIELMDEKSKYIIQSPTDGIVVSDTEIRKNQWLARGDQIGFIVPTNSRLIIGATIDPTYVDNIKVGDTAIILPSGANLRENKPINGKVISVSADTVKSKDDQNRSDVYLLDIEFSQDEFKDTYQFEAKAGMPVQAIITSKSVKLINYILDPILKSIQKSFHEF